MDANELKARIQAYEGELPKVRSVTDVYVKVMTALLEKLEADEIDAIIALGALVDDRSARMIPVLRWDQIGQMDEGRPIV